MDYPEIFEEVQTRFNTDDLSVLIEDGDIENVYDTDNKTE